MLTHTRKFGFRIAVLGTVALVPIGAAADSIKPDAAGVDFFEKKIRPVLADKCYECHSAESKKLKGGLRLDSRDATLKGGDTGPAIVPGQPNKSLLIKAVRYVDEDLQMPPKHRLAPEQVADLEAWVKMDAPDPRRESKPTTDPAGFDVSEGKKFWSFQPVKNPPPPAVKNQSWPRNDVDRFILAKLEEKKLSPAPDANKRTLIRRATFDLIGLPPTPEEIENFLADKSPNAFEKVVDRMLASPHYGERWGRHWLDVARYADTSGCNSDFPIPQAAKYRDYVINSFNTDKPYDQFIREQIAGDLLPAKSDEERFEKIVATGYLAIARRFGSRNNEFHLTIDDLTDNLGKGVLGLSLSCARCHDHKFDPIPTRDYYAIYGILNSTRYAFPGTEIYRAPKDFVALASGAGAETLKKYQAELADFDDEIEKLKNERLALAKAAKAGQKQKPSSDEPDEDDDEAMVKAKLALKEARKKQNDLAMNPPDVPMAYAVADGTVADAKIQKRGDPHKLGDVAPRGFLQVLGGQALPSEEKGSGRLELAQWLTDAKNPLTARVMVNRIWQHHFGRGIVRTPNDFGTRGKLPTHPELLDYLATRFMESGWSLKTMHKLVVLSHAYQMSAQTSSRSAKLDSVNDLMSRFNSRRLDAEEIRDAMLAISGNLDRAMGGTHPFPPQHEWLYSQHKPFVAVYETNRRSVYLMQQRIKKNPFLEMFDGADTNSSTGERPQSTTPLQALFMLNNPFAHEQAERFATRIGAAADESKRIALAYRLAFGRPPTAEETRTARDYVKQCAAELAAANVAEKERAQRAWASYARVLLSSNEFMFVD